MPEDENELKRIEATNKAKIRKAFEENPKLIRMMQTAREQNRTDILNQMNIDQLVEEFTSRSDIQIALRNMSYEPNMDSIGENVEALRYSISREENRFVFSENGSFDEQGSAEQSTDMAYRNSPDYAFTNLTREQLNEATLLGVERNDIIEYLLRPKSNYQDEIKISINDLPDSCKQFIIDLAGAKEFTEDELKNTVNTLVNVVEHIKTSLETNGFVTTPEELDFLLYINKLRSDTTLSEEKKNELLDRIASLPETQKYKDPETGKPSLKLAFEVEDQWENTYLSKKRLELFSDYNKKREDNYVWGELDAKEKDSIFGAIIQTIRDPKSSEEMILTAQAILLDLAPGNPKPITVSKSSDGKVVASFNDARIISIYNGMKSGRNMENVYDIYDIYEDRDRKMVTEKLNRLEDYYIANGTLLSNDDYKLFKEQDQQMSDDLKKIRDNLSEIQKAQERASIITKDAQKKLGLRLDAAIDSFYDPNTNEKLSFNDSVNCVMAAYRVLQKSSEFGLGMDLSNPEINKKAYELLQKHIKADSATYGNYLNALSDGTYEIKTGNGRGKNAKSILTSSELEKMARPGSPYYEYVQMIISETKTTAREEVLKDIPTAEVLFSRDGVETVANMAKDGIKYFVKGGLNFILGEERARATLDAVKNNKVYQAARNATYATVKGIYSFGKATIGLPVGLIGKPIANFLFPSSNRLALSSTGEKLNVRIDDLLAIMNHEAITNFIDTQEELEFTKIAVNLKNANQVEIPSIKSKLQKMECAQKYIDPKTGEIDLAKIQVIGNDWEKSNVQKVRAKSFYNYNKIRMQRKSFADLDDKDKFELLRAAVCSINDPEADISLKKMGIAVLADISPTLIQSKKDNKTKGLQYSINEKQLLKTYNELKGSDLKKNEDAVKAFKHNEKGLANERLERLSKPGELVSKSTWQAIQARKREQDKIKTYMEKILNSFMGPIPKLNEGLIDIDEAFNQRDKNQWRDDEAAKRTEEIGIAAGKAVADQTQVKVEFQAVAKEQDGMEK